LQPSTLERDEVPDRRTNVRYIGNAMAASSPVRRFCRFGEVE
jgi:hypothetical protein